MFPDRLAAAEPGWAVQTDVLVIGSGIAGLVAALLARSRLAGSVSPAAGSPPPGDGSPGHGSPLPGHRAAPPAARYGTRVLLVTKALLDEGSTRWAQGGIAAALAPDDTPEEHLQDTLRAGVGLCDPEAVRVLVNEGPAAVQRLIEFGTQFDREDDGALALTREGGHLRRRVAHAGGDATGMEISRSLLAALKSSGGIEVIEHALVLDLLKDERGHAAGATLHVMGEGRRDGVGAVRARAVILATGGLGQVFAATTNPEVSTGDGVALALRAGAAVSDLEFVQFHPTVLWLGPGARGQQPLISEAVRGEGAQLIDTAGRPVMAGRHPLGDLAPRDVVAKGIMARMRDSGADHVYLDGRGLGHQTWERRFPTILASCLAHGIDPVHEPIPVVPAAHYASGGVRTDLWGRTSIPGLYACGEVACTGVHGANRLASNSLLEGLVYAERIASVLPEVLDGARPGAAAPPEAASPQAASPQAAPPGGEPRRSGGPGQLLLDGTVREDVQRVMSADAGVLRSGESLSRAARALAELAGRRSQEPCVEAWEATNLHAVATAIVAAARMREETRGCHWREDFPDHDDGAWLGHLVTRRDPSGLTTGLEPVEAG